MCWVPFKCHETRWSHIKWRVELSQRFNRLRRAAFVAAAEVDATHIPVQQRGIGMVFQSYALFRHMTVAENITFGPRIQDLDIDEEER